MKWGAGTIGLGLVGMVKLSRRSSPLGKEILEGEPLQILIRSLYL